MTTAARISVAGDVAQDDMLRYAVMAAFMDSGRTLDLASSLLLIAALLAGLSGAFSGGPAATCFFAVNLCLAMIAKYHGWRIALDARLFMLLAQHPGQAVAFDDALADCLGRHAKGAHTAASRWAGAKRLLQYQAALVALQGLAAVGTGMARLA